MKSISLKLQEKILNDTEQILEHLNTSRNRYINEAVNFYNIHQKRKLLEQRLCEESKLVAEDSMNVLHEFESLLDEI